MPQGVDKQYNAVDMHYNLGLALFYCGNFSQSTIHLSEAVRLSPTEGKFHHDLAVALAAEGKTDDALKHYSKAISIKPALDKSPTVHNFLAIKYANEGQLRKAILSAEKALKLALAAGDQQLALQIKERLEFYQQQEIRERMERFK